MKKIFFAIFFGLVFAANNLTCHAELTRVADVGAENLYQSMQGILQAGTKKANFPLVASRLFRAPNADDSKFGLSAWACLYGLNNAAEPDGEVLFSVNGEGYVSSLKVVSYSNEKEKVQTASLMILSCLGALGLTPSEAGQLLNSLEGNDALMSSKVWGSTRNRYFLLMAVPRMQSDNGFQFLVIADDGRK